MQQLPGSSARGPGAPARRALRNHGDAPGAELHSPARAHLEGAVMVQQVSQAVAAEFQHTRRLGHTGGKDRGEGGRESG